MNRLLFDSLIEFFSTTTSKTARSRGILALSINCRTFSSLTLVKSCQLLVIRGADKGSDVAPTDLNHVCLEGVAGQEWDDRRHPIHWVVRTVVLAGFT